MKEILLHTLIHTIKDSIKLMPFLFIAFLIIELIEHKLSKKNKKILESSKKYGVIAGTILGVIPQCGFSVMATNLYITRIITLGTLISIYLSTSDEMLPIMLSHNVESKIILTILSIKIIFAIIYGIIIDLIIRKITKKEEKVNYDICKDEHCHCEEHLLLSVLKHTISIWIFIFIISYIINIIFHTVGEDFLSKLLLKDTIFSPFITSLIGLIPNCGTSVLLTELYLNNALDISSLISGLLTNSGTALLVLFKNNKNKKENIFILLLLYVLGVLSGLILKLIEIF